MPRLSDDEAVAFLQEREHLLRLATVTEDGSPALVPLWFLPEPDRLVVTARCASRWWSDLQRDPRVCASVDEEARPYRKVTVRGEMTVLYGPGRDAEWRDTYRTLCCRYQSPGEASAYLSETAAVPRVLLALPLDGDSVVTTWRVPLATEDSRGIWAERYWASAPPGGVG